MSINKNKYIQKICHLLSVNNDELLESIKIFEKYIKYQTDKYQNTYGIDDYKMNKYDYFILYYLYLYSKKCDYKFQMILLYMYSVYKLEGMEFDKKTFPFTHFFNFINNNKNLSSHLFQLLDCIEYIKNIKNLKRIKM